MRDDGAQSFWSSVRRITIWPALTLLAAIALVDNVRPDLVVDLCTAVGLRGFGPPTAQLLMRLTEGLVVLLLIPVYVERRPFRALERRLGGLESSLTQHVDDTGRDVERRLEDVQRQVKRQLTQLHLEHLEAQAARQNLRDLLVQRFDQLGNLMDLVVPERVNPVLG